MVPRVLIPAGGEVCAWPAAPVPTAMAAPLRAVEALLEHGQRRTVSSLPTGDSDDSQAFAGLVLVHAGEPVGAVGLVGRKGGYDDTLLDALAPLEGVVGQLIAAFEDHQACEEAHVRLQHLVQASPEALIAVDES